MYLSKNLDSVRISTRYESRQRFGRRVQSFYTDRRTHADYGQLEAFPRVERLRLQFLRGIRKTII